jgi:hypothetical protein
MIPLPFAGVCSAGMAAPQERMRCRYVEAKPDTSGWKREPKKTPQHASRYSVLLDRDVHSQQARRLPRAVATNPIAALISRTD